METRTRRDDAAVAALNELLRGELSAVETYDKALPAVEGQPALRENLQACRSSHELRVETIRRAIVDIGGEPVHASGAWGVFAKTVAGGARALGWKTVIATLEDGEELGLTEYHDTLPRPRREPAAARLGRARSRAAAHVRRDAGAQARGDRVIGS